MLYDTIKQLAPEGYENHLLIDYGPVAKLQDQYWAVEKGTEEFVTPFLAIPWLENYFTSFPRKREAEDGQAKVVSPSLSGQDPISQLPSEVVLLIMSHLDMRAVAQFQASSRRAAMVDLGKHWKLRLRADMPWLFDFPTESSDKSDTINWTQAYRDLMIASEHSHDKKILGLANRRRIWGLFEQIAKVYAPMQSSTETSPTLCEILAGASSTPTVLIAYPESKGSTSTTMHLVNSFHDLFHAEPVLSVFWNNGDRLSALEVRDSPASEPLPSRDDILIPRDDWVIGLIVYSTEIKQPGKRRPKRSVTGLEVIFGRQASTVLGKTTGDRRLFQASNSHFMVGFVYETSPDGEIVKLSLLEQPITKMPYGTDQRVKGHRQEIPTTEATKYLWGGEMPDSSLLFSDFSLGYWTLDLKVDVSPMEALTFGRFEEELADIVAIGADVHFGGFEVQYANQSPRTIGPRHFAMQYLKIDGRGGERIVCMYWSVGHIPTLIRFVTNRGRQLVVGHSPNERRYPSQENDGRTLMGFFGHWGNRLEPKADLVGIGGMYRDDLSGAAAPAAGGRDVRGFPWVPEPPSTSYIEMGRVWGERRGWAPFTLREQKDYPESGSVVSWLDCRYSLQSVKVSLCHGTRAEQIPLIAMAFEIASPQERHLPTHLAMGPTVFSRPADTEGTNGHHWCWCTLSHRRDGELESKPHHSHDTWQLCGQRLRSLKIWLSDKQKEEGTLAAMQLVAEDRSESPVWGHCEGDPSGSIDFIADNDPHDYKSDERARVAMGIKFFLGNNERQVSRNDTVVVAVQAMIQT